MSVLFEAVPLLSSKYWKADINSVSGIGVKLSKVSIIVFLFLAGLCHYENIGEGQFKCLGENSYDTRYCQSQKNFFLQNQKDVERFAYFNYTVWVFFAAALIHIVAINIHQHFEDGYMDTVLTSGGLSEEESAETILKNTKRFSEQHFHVFLNVGYNLAMAIVFSLQFYFFHSMIGFTRNEIPTFEDLFKMIGTTDRNRNDFLRDIFPAEILCKIVDSEGNSRELICQQTSNPTFEIFHLISWAFSFALLVIFVVDFFSKLITFYSLTTSKSINFSQKMILVIVKANVRRATWSDILKEIRNERFAYNTFDAKL